MLQILRGLQSAERISLIAAAVVIVFATMAVAVATEHPSGHPAAAPLAVEPAGQTGDSGPAHDPAPVAEGPGLAFGVSRVVVLAGPDGSAQVVSLVRGDVPLPVLEAHDGFVKVLTPCQVEGWVQADDVRIERSTPRGPRGSGRNFHEAVFVIDPGHGGRQPGAVGPTGLTEKETNMDISNRLRDRLAAAHDVDWSTGAVTAGTSYRPPRVDLTLRDDYEAGLRYRSEVANALDADAFLSIHNNAEPDTTSSVPGTETYFQFHNADSRRLAGLAYEEVFRALQPLGTDWVADLDAGAKYRLNSEGGDYYGVLRHARVPAVLVEASFISNPAEEALLRRPEVRQLIADAIYRALIRYFTTDDAGSGFVEPYPRGNMPSGQLPSTCVDPL